MGLNIIRFIFFGNYFIGLLALVLTIEASLQLGLPFNSLRYFALLFMVPVLYYTYAYMGATNSRFSANPRTRWYAEHAKFVQWSQRILLAGTVVVTGSYGISYHNAIWALPLSYWISLLTVLAIAILYYGLLPVFFFDLNLRNTGWLKPFIIGFVWASTVNLLPLMVLKIETGQDIPENAIWVFLFIKNWMFCTVNAIMFDMKDYAIDANSQLKTFVVRMGLRKTIFYILIPLLLIGMLSLLIFAWFNQFATLRILINLVPFLLTGWVAWSMNQRKQIFYYLIVIDGLILLKALCGITAMLI